jgi:5'-3' exonuclease
MDCNSIIYDSLREIECEDSNLETILIEKVIQKIVYYIEFIHPTTTVFIAFDGVAPFAKMDQQRNRRYKSVMLSKISGLIDPSSSLPTEKKDPKYSRFLSDHNQIDARKFESQLSSKIHRRELYLNFVFPEKNPKYSR